MATTADFNEVLCLQTYPLNLYIPGYYDIFVSVVFQRGERFL